MLYEYKAKGMARFLFSLKSGSLLAGSGHPSRWAVVIIVRQTLIKDKQSRLIYTWFLRFGTGSLSKWMIHRGEAKSLVSTPSGF